MMHGQKNIKLADVSEEPATSIFKVFTFLYSPSQG